MSSSCAGSEDSELFSSSSFSLSASASSSSFYESLELEESSSAIELVDGSSADTSIVVHLLSIVSTVDAVLSK